MGRWREWGCVRYREGGGGVGCVRVRRCARWVMCGGGSGGVWVWAGVGGWGCWWSCAWWLLVGDEKGCVCMVGCVCDN